MVKKHNRTKRRIHKKRRTNKSGGFSPWGSAKRLGRRIKRSAKKFGRKVTGDPNYRFGDITKKLVKTGDLEKGLDFVEYLATIAGRPDIALMINRIKQEVSNQRARMETIIQSSTLSNQPLSNQPLSMVANRCSNPSMPSSSPERVNEWLNAQQSSRMLSQSSGYSPTYQSNPLLDPWKTN